MRLTVESPEAMAELGRRIARQLLPGDIVALNGELGAGKTTLTRGLGDELSVRGTVTSPTFVLARTHPRASGVPLVHVDAYRLSSAAELDDLDIDFAGSITVVEWAAGMLDGLSDSLLEITIDRPTGAGAAPDAGRSEAAGAAVGESHDAVEAVDAVDPEEVDEVDEPRTVTIVAAGPRWEASPFV